MFVDDCSSRSRSFGWTTAFASHAKSPRLLSSSFLAEEEEKKSPVVVVVVGNRFSTNPLPLVLVVPSDRRPVKLALEPVLALLESLTLLLRLHFARAPPPTRAAAEAEAHDDIFFEEKCPGGKERDEE